MLPRIMNSPTPENGARILNDMGVDKKFLDDMYGKYSSYATKIPGLNKNMVNNALRTLNKAMDGTQKQSPRAGFDRSKYPKF